MALLPAHQRLLEDDVEDDLTNHQIQNMLKEASARVHQNLATGPSTSDALFKLPRLDPGHITQDIITTKGSITRLDTSSLVNKKDKALANGVKKIEDPIAIRKQKQEVGCCLPHNPRR